MIIYYFGKIYYSRVLSWIGVVLLSLSVPAAAIAWQYQLHECLSEDAQSLALLVADYWLAATLLSGPLWYLLAYSFSVFDPQQPELFALRCASAVTVALASTQLVVLLLPRAVLAATAALYIGFSLNVGCWWASLWLHLQAEGLAAQLPPSLRHALMTERPLDWLRRNDWTALLLRVRQVLPLLVLPDSELHHGLAVLPAELRERLERRGLACELPDSARQLLQPWAAGPDLLRVRPLPLALPSLVTDGPEPSSPLLNGQLNGHVNGHAHASTRRLSGHAVVDGSSEDGDNARGRAPAATARAPIRRAGTPEWLLLYAARCHVSRLLRERLEDAVGAEAAAAMRSLGNFGGGLAASLEVKAAVAALVASVAARRLGGHGSRPGVLGPRARTLGLVLGAVVAAKLVHRLRMLRERAAAPRPRTR